MGEQKYFLYKSKNNCLKLLIDTSFYPQEPLYATCYVFMDNYHISLDADKNKNKYKISLTPKDNKKYDLKKLAFEFQDELINNCLRYKISNRNQKIRELIVREALLFSQPKEAQEEIVKKLAINRKKNKD